MNAYAYISNKLRALLAFNTGKGLCDGVIFLPIGIRSIDGKLEVCKFLSCFNDRRCSNVYIQIIVICVQSAGNVRADNRHQLRLSCNLVSTANDARNCDGTGLYRLRFDSTAHLVDALCL